MAPTAVLDVAKWPSPSNLYGPHSANSAILQGAAFLTFLGFESRQGGSAVELGENIAKRVG